MPKPRKTRVVRFDPEATYFKPQNVPLAVLEEVVLTLVEFEAIRLADLKEFDQTKAAKKMKISQATFNRTLTSAHKKIAEALTYGKAIKMEGGEYVMPLRLSRGLGLGHGFGFGRGRMGGPYAAGPGGTCVCSNQDCQQEVPHQIGVPCVQQKCPKCGSPMVRK